MAVAKSMVTSAEARCGESESSSGINISPELLILQGQLETQTLFKFASVNLWIFGLFWTLFFGLFRAFYNLTTLEKFT